MFCSDRIRRLSKNCCVKIEFVPNKNAPEVALLRPKCQEIGQCILVIQRNTLVYHIVFVVLMTARLQNVRYSGSYWLIVDNIVVVRLLVKIMSDRMT